MLTERLHFTSMSMKKLFFVNLSLHLGKQIQNIQCIFIYNNIIYVCHPKTQQSSSHMFKLIKSQCFIQSPLREQGYMCAETFTLNKFSHLKGTKRIPTAQTGRQAFHTRTLKVKCISLRCVQ